ncbi:hypothetical protein HAX54_011496, partial [Datura stramonium]|nr:hypothetical protein [Datura stramonium]
ITIHTFTAIIDHSSHFTASQIHNSQSQVRGQRLRGEIGEATGERTGRNLEEADSGVTGVATGDYGRRRVDDDRR